MRRKRLIKIIILVLIISVGGFFAYRYFFGDGLNTPLLPNNNKKEKIEIKNGIYINRQKLKKAYNISNKCNVSSNDKIIVVYGKKYRMYSGNCLLMKYLGEHDNNLNFKMDGKKYYIEYNNEKYVKDDNITKIDEGNHVLTSINTINFIYLDFIVKNTEKKGEYYYFTTAVTGFTFPAFFTASVDDFSGELMIELGGSMNRYKTSLDDVNNFPSIMSYNGNIAIIEKFDYKTKRFGNLLLYSDEGSTYSFNNHLPILVNGVSITKTWNSVFRYDSSNKKFYALLSQDYNMCNEDEDKSYYEFTLDYDYKSKGFKAPVLKNVGSKGNGSCEYVKKYYLKG